MYSNVIMEIHVNLFQKVNHYWCLKIQNDLMSNDGRCMDFTYPPHHYHGMLERLVELLAVNIHIFVWVLPRCSWKYQHAGLTVMHLLVGKYPINGGWSAKIILATGGISSHSNDWRFLYWSNYLNPAGYIYILYSYYYYYYYHYYYIYILYIIYYIHIST